MLHSGGRRVGAHSEGRALQLVWEPEREAGLRGGGWERTGAQAQSPLCPLEPGGYLLLEIKAWKLFWAQFPALPESRTKAFTCHGQGVPAWGASF